MNIIYYTESIQIEINKGKKAHETMSQKPGQASIVHSQWSHRDCLILLAIMYATLAKSYQPRKLNHVSLGIQGFFLRWVGGLRHVNMQHHNVFDLSYSDSIIPPFTHNRKGIHCKSCC